MMKATRRRNSGGTKMAGRELPCGRERRKTRSACPLDVQPPVDSEKSSTSLRAQADVPAQRVDAERRIAVPFAEMQFLAGAVLAAALRLGSEVIVDATTESGDVETSCRLFREPQRDVAADRLEAEGT